MTITAQWKDELRARSGKTFTYTLIEKPDAVWIVPATRAGELVLINQYRYTVGTWCLEVPAGNIEPGHDAPTMAARELREEIGGVADTITLVSEVFTMNGIGNENAKVFLATGVVLLEPEHEDTELIELRRVSIPEGLHMARTGAIKDGISALAILMCEPLLKQIEAELQP